MTTASPQGLSHRLRACRELAWHFAGLGLVAFGGPSAHLAWFRRRFVQQLRWMDEAAYAELVALCQFLPGPASSQVGMAIGHRRAGHLGAAVAWLSFTLPSALMLAAFGLGVSHISATAGPWLQGLKLAALAIVAHALWGMTQALCPDRMRRVLALLSTACLLALPHASAQVAIMLLCGAAFAWWSRLDVPSPDTEPHHEAPAGWWRGLRWWLALALLVVGAALWAQASGDAISAQIATLLRVGATVFGGGHVVLPLLHSSFVDSGWMDAALFQAGYGAAQAVPGPLFTFAAFLGAASDVGLSGWGGALIATVAIFVPAYALLMGGLQLWQQLKQAPRVLAALAGVNAAVVGVLAATWLHPMLSQSIHHAVDAIIGAAAALALLRWGAKPLWVIAACVIARGVWSWVV